MTGEGFKHEVLCAVGQHGYEHEDREPAGLVVLPDIAQGGAEVAFRLFCFIGNTGESSFDTGHRHACDGKGQNRHPCRHRNEARDRKRIEQAAGNACRHGHAEDHHQPDDGCSRRTPARFNPGSKQRQQRGAARAHACADQQEGDQGKRHAGSR